MMTASLKLFYCEIAGVFSRFRLKAFRFHVQHSDLNASWVSFHRAAFSSIFFSSSKSYHLFQLGVFCSPLNSRHSSGYCFTPCFLSFLVSMIRSHFLESSPVSLGEVHYILLSFRSVLIHPHCIYCAFQHRGGSQSSTGRAQMEN